jgi:hypothetical protein
LCCGSFGAAVGSTLPPPDSGFWSFFETMAMWTEILSLGRREAD